MGLMLIGRTGSGKTTLSQKVNNEKIEYKKTQMISYVGKIIDTPGEYVENRMYYKSLNVISTDASCIGLVQPSIDKTSVFPPNFASMFLNKEVIGIITKIDLNEDTKIARKLLELAGVQIIVEIKEGKELEGLQKYMEM